MNSTTCNHVWFEPQGSHSQDAIPYQCEFCNASVTFGWGDLFQLVNDLDEVVPGGVPFTDLNAVENAILTCLWEEKQ